MFKPRRRAYQKRSRPFQPLLILLAIPLILIVLELLTRTIVGATGKRDELTSYEGDTPIVNAYRLKFLDQAGKPYDLLPNYGSLIAKRRLSTSYKLAENQKNEYWQINEQGFRDFKAVPETKPKDEIRVFVVGGSTAFGQMSLNNQTTFATKLENLLNQRVAQQKAAPQSFRPDPLPVYRPERLQALTLPIPIREGKYRVINAAVPGYASGNELAQLALQIWAYAPDVIVVLDGYADLMLPSSQQEVNIPHLDTFANNAPHHYGVYLKQKMQEWVNQAYLVKATNYWLLRPKQPVTRLSLAVTDQETPLVKRLADNPTELKSRTQRYKNNISQMARLTAPAQIPLIVALQPEITAKSKRSPTEEKLVKDELGSTYTQRVQAGYAELAKATQQVQQAFPTNVRSLNLYKLYENFPSQAFHDAVHLTDEANTVLADRLYKAILDLPQLQPPPPKPLR